MKKTKNKKNKEENKNKDNLEDKNIEDLINIVENLNDKHYEILIQRNYAQQERDLIEKYYLSTQEKTEQTYKKIIEQEGEYQKASDMHNKELQTYVQKLKQLEFENEKQKISLEIEHENNLAEEDDYNMKKMEEILNSKKLTKKNIRENQIENQKDIEEKQKKNKGLLISAKNDYKKELQKYQEKHEKNLIELKKELELKIKTEIHEIEERKNHHINELIKNHQKAFEELKAFYVYVTTENLNLVQAQKEELEQRSENHDSTVKKIQHLKERNQELELIKSQAHTELQNLKHILKQYHKDKISLSNLKIKQKTLIKKLESLKLEKEDLNEKFDKIVQDIAISKRTYESKSKTIKENLEKPQQKMQKNLNNSKKSFVQKQAQFKKLIENFQLSNRDVQNILQETQENVCKKDQMLQRLEYLLQFSLKHFNDTLNVYQAKLRNLGIEEHQLGYENLETFATKMPVGIVNKQL